MLKGRDRFANLGVDSRDLINRYMNKSREGISAFVESTLESYFAREKPEAREWIVKDGHNGYHLNQIHDEIPDALYLHVLRDGRGVLSSMMRTTNPYGKGEAMARDPLTAARNWRNLVARIDAFSRKHPGLVLEVKYEDLLEDTAKELGRIRQFLGLESVPVPSLTGAEGYYSKIPDKEKRIHGLLTKEPLKIRSNAWLGELPETSRMLFEHIARDTLIDKGYGSVKRIEKKHFLTNPRLKREYIVSVVKRYKSWIEHLLNPALLIKIVSLKLLRRKDRETP